MDRSLCSSRCVVIHTKLAYLERILLYFYRKLLYSIYLSASQHTSNCFFHYSVVDITSTLSSEAFHIAYYIPIYLLLLLFPIYYRTMFISLLSKWSVYLRIQVWAWSQRFLIRNRSLHFYYFIFIYLCHVRLYTYTLSYTSYMTLAIHNHILVLLIVCIYLRTSTSVWFIHSDL